MSDASEDIAFAQPVYAAAVYDFLDRPAVSHCARTLLASQLGHYPFGTTAPNKRLIAGCYHPDDDSPGDKALNLLLDGAHKPYVVETDTFGTTPIVLLAQHYKPVDDLQVSDLTEMLVLLDLPASKQGNLIAAATAFLAPLLRRSHAPARPLLVRLYIMAARIELMALHFKIKDAKSTIPEQDDDEDDMSISTKGSGKSSRTGSGTDNNAKRKSGYDHLAGGFTHQQQHNASASHGAPSESLAGVLSALTEGLVNATDHNSQGAVARDRQRRAHYDRATRATKDIEPFLPLHDMSRNVDVMAVNKGLLPYPRPPAATPAIKDLSRYAAELFASESTFRAQIAQNSEDASTRMREICQEASNSHLTAERFTELQQWVHVQALYSKLAIHLPMLNAHSCGKELGWGWIVHVLLQMIILALKTGDAAAWDTVPELLTAKATVCFTPVAAFWHTHVQAMAAQEHLYQPSTHHPPPKRPRSDQYRGGFAGRHVGRGGRAIDRTVPGGTGQIFCALHQRFGAHTTAECRMQLGRTQGPAVATAAAATGATPGTSLPLGSLPPLRLPPPLRSYPPPRVIPIVSLPSLPPALPSLPQFDPQPVSVMPPRSVERAPHPGQGTATSAGERQRMSACSPPHPAPASAVPIPAADITHRSRSSFHPLIAQHVDSHLTYPLPAAWRKYLPQVASFSAIDKLLSTPTSTSSTSTSFTPQPLLPPGSVSLPGLQRAARASILKQLKASSGTSPEAPEEEIHAYNDAAGYVKVYTSSMVGTIDEHVYSKRIATPNTASAIDISELWQLHQRSCAPCRQLGTFDQAVAGAANITNPCYISHIMAWVSGQWRLPLTKQPKRTDTPNYESFRACPHSLAHSLEKMQSILTLSSTTRRAEVILPMLAVVRADDLFRAHHSLQQLGAPFDGAHHHKKGIQELDPLNAHIAATCLAQPAAAALLRLAQVKPRPCVDMGQINDLTNPNRFPYCNIHHAVGSIRPGYYMAKLDLEKAFNQLPIHPESAVFMGIRLADGEVYLPDRAVFGGKLFPAYCNALMAEIHRGLATYDVEAPFLTDDMFVGGETKMMCQANLDCALSVLHNVGLQVNHDKTEGPSRELTFLGIHITSSPNPNLCTLSIDQTKIRARLAEITACLAAQPTSRPFTRAQYESLLGKLAWISTVLPAGLPRTKCIWSAINYQLPRKAGVKLGADVVGQRALAALTWWRNTLENAKNHGIWAPWWSGTVPVHARTYSDASGNVGFGIVFDLHGRSTVIQGTWTEATAASPNIAVQELIPVLFAVETMAPLAKGKVLIITTDNVGNAFSLNRGTCRSPAAFDILNLIFEAAGRHNVYLVGDWIPRDYNTLSDKLSKYQLSVRGI